MAFPTTLVPAPSSGTSAHGLLSAIQLYSTGNERWTGAGIQFEDTEPGVLKTYDSVACLPEPVTRDMSGGLLHNEFYPFTIYSPFDCSLASVTNDEAVQLATSRLVEGEEVAAEAKLWKIMGEEIAKPTYQRPSIPENARDLVHALGILEHHLVREYGGGVIHVPRFLGSLLKNTRVTGATLRTIGGVTIILGAGYGEAGAENRLIGTPPIFGYRSELQVLNTKDLGHNDYMVAVEREYVIGWGIGKPVSIGITDQAN